MQSAILVLGRDWFVMGSDRFLMGVRGGTSVVWLERV